MGGSPSKNLPLGPTGIFVPVWDGWAYPGTDTWGAVTRAAAGIYNVASQGVAAFAALNLNKVLARAFDQPISPNVPGGSELIGGLLVGFDVIYGITGTVTITPVIRDTLFQNGAAPIQKFTGDGVTPALVLSPAILPATPQTGIITNVIQVMLANYWLIAQNQADDSCVLELGVTGAGTFTLYGVQLYFQQTQG
jgi:hypothetical protein